MGSRFLRLTDRNLYTDSRLSARRALPAAQPVQTTDAAIASDGAADTVFTWEDDHGGHHRAAVNSRRYEDYASNRRSLIAQDQQRALDAAAQVLRTSIAPVFREVEARVPYYGNWVFDWWTSWILLGRAFGWTWHALTDGPILTLPDRVQASLVDAVQQQFNALVLKPGITEAKLKPAIDRSRAAAHRNARTRRTALRWNSWSMPVKPYCWRW